MAEKDKQDSNATQDKPNAAHDKDVPKLADVEPEVRMYPVERVIAEAEAFTGGKYAMHVMAGALADYRKKNVSIEEAEELAKQFLKRPVEVEA